MKTFILAGVNQLGNSVALGKDVISFTDKDKKFSITITDASYIQLKTEKGVYNLSKHPTLNYYHAVCGGHKVQIHLKAVSGWLKFW
jgi:hypothetical protein